MDGEFLKLMSEEEYSILLQLRMVSLPEYMSRFTWNPCVHVLI